MVQEVPEVHTRQHPVVRGVFDEVPERHGGGGEAVHANGLVLALDEVEHDERAEEVLALGGWGEGAERVDGGGAGDVAERVVGGVGVQVVAQVQERGVDEDRPEVLGDEGRAPANLLACDWGLVEGNAGEGMGGSYQGPSHARCCRRGAQSL